MKQPALFALPAALAALFLFTPSAPLAAAPDKEKDKQKEKPAAEAAERAKPKEAEKAESKDKPAAKPDRKPRPKPRPEPGNELYTETFEVAPSFLQQTAQSVPTDPFADHDGEAIRGIPTAKQALELVGVEFGPGASVSYGPATCALVVRNTREQLELVAAYVAQLDAQRERQLHILVEFIEVEHAKFSDWLFENRLDGDGTELRRMLQEGIRDGEATVVESMLVTARSGQRAKAESVLEFIYPTEFDPPEIPNEVELSDKSKAPVTAITPTAFETRNVGSTLEVDPVIGSDNHTIDLNLAPEMVSHDGYTTWPNEEIEAIFKQRLPSFYTMRITTQVTLTEGRYALLGSVRPKEASTKGIKDPIILGFARADIGVVPLKKSK